MQIRIFFILFAAILASAYAFSQNFGNVEHWTVPTTDPVAAVGHGALLDAQGRDIQPTPEFVLQAQHFYIKQLYSAAGEATRAEFNAKQRRLSEARQLNEREQILTNAALLTWLIDAVKPRNAAELGTRNTVLRNRFVRNADQDAGISREILERIRQEGLLKPLSATSSGGQSYIDECRNAGVPTPPDWGSPSWSARGALPFKFIIPGQAAEVFTFQSDQPRGVCYALPRSSGNTIKALGVICLGTETSKSCFWDNLELFPNGTKAPFDIPKGTGVPLSRFAGGADLLNGNGVCSDCHAGENPFIIHPGTPLDLGSATTPANWSVPLVHKSWPQNQGPTNVLQTVPLNPGDGSCLTCHATGRRFPEVSTDLPKYCDTILPSAVSKTMPPGDVGNPKYAKHINALMAACKRPPPGPVEVVVNGATQSPPISGRSDTGGDLGPCTGGDCPLGFCYWKTLHGPFWQQTDSGIPIADPKYRGSFLRIYAEMGRWKWRAFSDTTELPANAPPGGTAECVNYNQIVNVPDPNSCFANMFAITDPIGTTFSSLVDATVIGTTADVLSGYIGNVAQSNDNEPDVLRVFEQGGRVNLVQRHNSTPLPPFRLGPLTGESWTNGCKGWVPKFLATDVLSTSDVQLVSEPQARDARCYLTGITGAWSSTRNNAAVQPFAEIYVGPGEDLRLRVSPSGDARDRVGAYASCFATR